MSHIRMGERGSRPDEPAAGITSRGLLGALRDDRTARMLAFAAVALLFWVVRVRYWSTTFELPFSDMADFDQIARNLASGGGFEHSPFWRSFKPPLLPLLRGIQIRLSGDGLWPWEVLQSALVFVGLCWLIREIVLATGRWPLAWVLGITVALCKSSIFWSLKIATEGVAEAFVYLSIAAILCALRMRTAVAAFGAGVVLTAASLNRPNTVFALPLLLLGIAVAEGRAARARGGSWPWRVALRNVGACLLACALVWAPWLVRSYRLYGAVLPFNTSGATTFIYGVWLIEWEEPDGRWVMKDYVEVMREAPRRFATDYEFEQWGRRAVRRWLRRNWTLLPGLVVARARDDVANRDVMLSRVSRVELLPPSINRLLLDKTPAAVVLGILGLCLLPVVIVPRLVWIPLVSLPAWLSTLVMQDNPRLLEPTLPIFLFGCVTWPYALARIGALRRLATALEARLPAAGNVYLSHALSAGVLALVTLVAVVPQPAAASGVRLSLRNPGFEKWGVDNTPLAWSLWAEGRGTVIPQEGQSHEGRRCALVTQREGTVALYQDVPDPRSIAGKDFTATVWVKSSEAGGAYVAISDSGHWLVSERYSQVGQWQALVVGGIGADTAAGFRLHFFVDHGSACADDASVILWATPAMETEATPAAPAGHELALRSLRQGTDR